MSINTRVAFSILAIGILGAGILISVALVSPPSPEPIDAPATIFSAGRAYQHLTVIAQEPRPMGVFPAHAEARDYIVNQIRAMGLEPQIQETFGFRLVEPGFVIGGSVENILVRLPGYNPDGAILLIAHYDSTPGGPGAGDNGSGVVTILETLRTLHTNSTLRQDVIVLFPDGHEPGIIGTHAFAAQHPWFDEVKLVINIDLRGAGPLTLAYNPQGNDSWIPALAHTAGNPAFLSLPSHLFPGGENDLIPFIEAGVPGVSFASTTYLQEIHTALDRPENVEPGALQHAGNQLVSLVSYLADQPTLEVGAPEQTYFPVLGKLIHYPSSWSIPMTILAGAVLLETLWAGFSTGVLTTKGVGLGSLAFLASLALGVGAVLLLWVGIQALHPEYAYSPLRPHLSDDTLFFIAFVLLALAVTFLLIAATRKRVSSFDLAAGAAVVWLPIAFGTTVLFPATSYLASWTLLLNALALLLACYAQSRGNAWAWSLGAFLASAALVTFLWLPLIYIAFIGPGFTMLWMVIALAALWIVAILPVLDQLETLTGRFLPAAALVSAIGLLLFGNFTVGHESPPPMVNSVGYCLDTESGVAEWIAFIGGSRIDARTVVDYEVAFPEAMDERQNRLLTDPVRRDYTDVLPVAPAFSVLTSKAPLLPVDGPNLEIINDVWLDGRRMVTIRITASMHDRTYVIIPEGSTLLALTVPQNGRTELPPILEGDWILRFDGTPVEGVEMVLEFSTPESIQLVIVEENTGLPDFPGLSTQPVPGTMPSPGEFYQGVPADFTAVYREFVIP